MHWGIRRYQNPDGTLTAEGRSRKQFGRRISKADYTRQDVDSIVNSLSTKDKKSLQAENGYLSFEQGGYVVKRLLLKDGDKPVAFMDFLSDGSKDGKKESTSSYSCGRKLSRKRLWFQDSQTRF